MGDVYKAHDTKLKREVAIKFLPKHIAANEEERERFKIEAQAAASANHPNIATIHSIEESEDQMFIVMEYIEGKELKVLIHKIPLDSPLKKRESKQFPPYVKCTDLEDWRDAALIWITVDPGCDSLRRDKRFLVLLNRMDLTSQIGKNTQGENYSFQEIVHKKVLAFSQQDFTGIACFLKS